MGYLEIGIYIPILEMDVDHERFEFDPPCLGVPLILFYGPLYIHRQISFSSVKILNFQGASNMEDSYS